MKLFYVALISILKILFLCLKLYAFLAINHMSSSSYLIFLFCRAFWKFNFLYSCCCCCCCFYPQSLFLLSDRRASDETTTKKKVKSALYRNVRGKGGWKTETSDKAKWCEPSPPSNSNFSVSHVNLHVIAKAGNRAKLRSPLTVQAP